MHKKLFILLTLVISILALFTVSCGSETPSPTPTSSIKPTEQVAKSVTPTIIRPTRIPTQSMDQRIRDWALEAYEQSCDFNYREDAYQTEITNIGQGSVTQRMKTDQNIEDVWCVTITGKCGNVDFTKNITYVKASGEWQAAFQDPYWGGGVWEKLGCPFKMTR